MERKSEIRTTKIPVTDYFMAYIQSAEPLAQRYSMMKHHPLLWPRKFVGNSTLSLQRYYPEGLSPPKLYAWTVILQSM